MVLRILPGASVNVWVIGYGFGHVPMAPTMAEIVIEDGPFPEVLQIRNKMDRVTAVLVVLYKSSGFSLPFRFQ